MVKGRLNGFPFHDFIFEYNQYKSSETLLYPPILIKKMKDDPDLISKRKMIGTKGKNLYEFNF